MHFVLTFAMPRLSRAIPLPVEPFVHRRRLEMLGSMRLVKPCCPLKKKMPRCERQLQRKSLREYVFYQCRITTQIVLLDMKRVGPRQLFPVVAHHPPKKACPVLLDRVAPLRVLPLVITSRTRQQHNELCYTQLFYNFQSNLKWSDC